ncbi:MAG TPA: DinB family protein, partial [candidate division Zixibacteria bacterium]|nr:DinB family protein [candidate division Zixibacteria bacterium]
YYLSGQDDDFKPPEPFTLSELDPSGVMPDRVYTKDELLTYLKHCHEKARKVIKEMTEQWIEQQYKFAKVTLNYGELLLYNMRHFQHHAAQLNMILRRETDSAPGWVFTAKKPLGL